MTQTVTLRRATTSDIVALDRLFKRSYMTMLKRHYTPSALVSCIPIVAQAQPHLIRSGTYFVAEADGVVLGAGGWSGQGAGLRPSARGVAHIRHVAVDPSVVRHGIGRLIVDQAVAQAHDAGLTRVDAVSTLNAVPFYETLGFSVRGNTQIDLPGGIRFDCVSMERAI